MSAQDAFARAFGCQTRLYVLLSAVLPGILAGFEHCSAQKAFAPIDHRLFDPGNRVHSSASPAVNDLIRVARPGIIRPPVDDQQYDDWLEAMHLYRRSALGLDLDDSSKDEMLYTIDFQGHRGSWLRLNERLSRALKLTSGEELTWKIDARANKDGNRRFYLAFDIHNRQGQKIGWSDLDEFPVDIPDDGQWHTVTVKASGPGVQQGRSLDAANLRNGPGLRSNARED